MSGRAGEAAHQPEAQASGTGGARSGSAGSAWCWLSHKSAGMRCAARARPLCRPAHSPCSAVPRRAGLHRAAQGTCTGGAAQGAHGAFQRMTNNIAPDAISVENKKTIVVRFRMIIFSTIMGSVHAAQPTKYNSKQAYGCLPQHQLKYCLRS